MRKAGFLLFGLTGALVLSQFPEYFQQYTQRLGGHLDEISAQVASLEQRAADAGKDVPGYLRSFLLNRDVDIRREGMHLRSLVDRQLELSTAYEALTGAGSLWRAQRFAKHVDWEIASSTLTVYRPAVPVTAESAIYTGAGFGTGAVIFLVILGLWGPERRNSRQPKSAKRR